MPKNASFEPVKVKGRISKWLVNLPAKYSETGRRERHFFQRKEQAATFCEQIKVRLANFGTQARMITPVQAEQALQAFEKLASFGVSLNTVVEDWIARRQRARASISFEKLIDEYCNAGRHGRSRSKSYRQSILQIRNRLQSLHGRAVSEIVPRDVDAALHGMTSSVRNFTLRILSCAFNLGLARGYLHENPIQKVEHASIASAEIEVYTPGEVGQILKAAEDYFPELLPFLAISFFAGIRRSEILRLNWSHVELEERYIRLPKQITKTHQGRHIQIEQNLVAWLSLSSQRDGQIVPFSPSVLRRRERQLRLKHGIKTIKHGPRHCFGTYWLALHENIDRLMLSMGHTDFDTTQEHYAKAATRKTAQQFWGIFPSIREIGIVPLEAVP